MGLRHRGNGKQAEAARPARRFVVHIVESLKPEEIFSDQGEGEALNSVLRQIGVKCRLRRAVNQRTFGIALGEIAGNWQSGDVPILHISAHGSTDGVGLTDGTMLPWGQMKDALELVNKEIAGGLILCMSTCHGIQAHQLVGSSTDRPFHLLIGPIDKVQSRDTLVGGSSPASEALALLSSRRCSPATSDSIAAAAHKCQSFDT